MTSLISKPRDRCCTSCQTTLAADNSSRLCGPCARMQDATTAPNHPPQFWEDVSIRTALATQNFGRFLTAYREAHKPVIKQAQIGEWINLTQGQVSRIEHAVTPVHDIVKLVRWADALRVPQHLLWFRKHQSSETWDSGQSSSIAESHVDDTEAALNRRELLQSSLAAAVAAGASLVGGLRAITERECAERLAWDLWQRGLDAIHASDLPLSVATYLGVVDAQGKITAGLMRVSPEGLIIGDNDNFFSFVQPSLVDFYVGQHIFGNIAAGESHLLATAQTSHETDLVLQKLVQRHESSIGLLVRWMRNGATPVLQVNSAGILAKAGNNRLTDVVINALKSNRDTRQLYLTAVANRVLGLDWDHASSIASMVENDQPNVDLSADQLSRLVKELSNPRDGAARWCTVLFLGQASNCDCHLARTSLHRALQQEPCAETLRSIGNALAGHHPLNV